MKLELKLYLPKRWIEQIDAFKYMMLAFAYRFRRYVLPFIQVIAGIIMVISIACMDSPNFRVVFMSYCMSFLVLISCYIFGNIIDTELRKFRRLRYRY